MNEKTEAIKHFTFFKMDYNENKYRVYIKDFGFTYATFVVDVLKSYSLFGFKFNWWCTLIYNTRDYCLGDSFNRSEYYDIDFVRKQLIKCLCQKEYIDKAAKTDKHYVHKSEI
jgi:hypothetical protein